jgi:SAM-dependent methyltransferase
MEAGVRSPDDIRDANTRYHDAAAATYDAKWGIDFGEVGRGQVLKKLHKLLDPALGGARFGQALEIGAGTGYFSLNLLSAGLIDELTCTDISPGMLATLADNARRLELDVAAATADAEELPFDDQSFDLVLGHAVLHHLPAPERAFSEFHRVLRPGGRILFAGEPSRVGDRLASLPKRAAVLAGPAWRAALGAAPFSSANGADHEPAETDLETAVDVHAFAPADLTELAIAAGFADVEVRGEELTANWFGWFNRGLEMSARPQDIPMLWRQYAFRGYLTLQWLDAVVFEPHLPAALFYNLLLTARRP